MKNVGQDGNQMLLLGQQHASHADQMSIQMDLNVIDALKIWSLSAETEAYLSTQQVNWNAAVQMACTTYVRHMLTLFAGPVRLQGDSLAIHGHQ